MMLKSLFKKQNKIESLVYDYLEALALGQESFLNALNACFLSGTTCEDFDFFIGQTHKYESKADDIREEINNMMYGKVLIPDARGDIMELLTCIDEIPRLYEHILYMIHDQQIMLPEFLLADVKDLLRISVECCDLLIQQTTALFQKKEGIRSFVNKIDINESHCDHAERRIIGRVFTSDMDPFDKLQIKELIQLMGDISDQADSCSRLINIISMKRRV
jgi:predicted phosphate transport protein (TIGR00153 family)